MPSTEETDGVRSHIQQEPFDDLHRAGGGCPGRLPAGQGAMVKETVCTRICPSAKTKVSAPSSMRPWGEDRVHRSSSASPANVVELNANSAPGRALRAAE